MRVLRGLTSCLAALGCLALASCAPSQQGDMKATHAGLPGVTEQYRIATRPHWKQHRKPVRDERARAMAALAAHAEKLANDASTWDSEARLVSIAQADRPAVRGAAADFTNSLNNLRAAAEREDVAAVRTSYSRALASYRTLQKNAGVID